jgi:hypothetical protein
VKVDRERLYRQQVYKCSMARPSSVSMISGIMASFCIRALGKAGDLTLHCVYTHRREVPRIISRRYANRKERDAYRATYPG